MPTNQPNSALSEEGVDRVVERLNAKTKDSPIFRGLDDDQRKAILQTAVRAVALDSIERPDVLRLADLDDETRERLDQPLNRVPAPVDRVDHEVPRV